MFGMLNCLNITKWEYLNDIVNSPFLSWVNFKNVYVIDMS